MTNIASIMNVPQYSLSLARYFVLFLSIHLMAHHTVLAQSNREKIDTLVQPYIDSETLDGLCVGILYEGQSSVHGYGKVGSNASEKPNADTVYEIGSVSKVFTSLLLADAITRGKVRLDQPIVELFPKDMPEPNTSLSKINFAHLSTHTSGLPRLPSNLDLTVIDDPYANYTPKMLFHFLNEHKLTRSPGSKYEYSNLGAGLLGLLITNQDKTGYESSLKQHILDPLSMNDTSITLSESQKLRLAPGHDIDGTRCSPWEFSALVAAGGIRSTVKDMLKFASANLSPPAGKLGEAIELGWKIHQTPLAKSDHAMGLGWLIARDGVTRFHNGQTGGYHSVIYVSREHNLAVTALCSTASGDVDRLAEDIFKLLAGKEVEPRKFEPGVEVADEVMQKYVGVYQLVPNVEFTVSVQDGKLMVGLTGQPTFRVYPKSETEWSYKVVKATITFRKDRQGNWNELVLFQNGIRQKAVRKK